MAVLYRHIRLDKNLPFYIGIGKNESRAYSKSQRNIHWKRIVDKTDYEVEILFDDLTWDEACEKEIEFIKLYGRHDLDLGPLCNQTDGGDGGLGSKHNLGKKRSDDTKLKISESMKGHKRNLGKKHSDETKLKLKEKRKLQIISDETRKKMSETQKGRIFSDESKIKMSQSSKGKKHSDETRKKMSELLKGKKRSDETKLKISEATKLYWLNKKSSTK